MKKKLTFTILICLFLCLIAALALKLHFRGAADKGILLQPQKDYPADTDMVIPYCQKNEAWKEDRLGTSSCTMGSSGCLTSCIASALSTQHKATGAGQAVSAGELNRLLGETGVYNKSGDIVWGELAKALPKAEVVVAASVDERQIEELMDQGRYPVVKVKVGGRGAAHWVLLVGSRDGEYLCMDPLEEDGEPVPLSRHGGVVYRMRCVYWND